MHAVKFQLNAVDVLARWVLDLPILDWQPDVQRLPRITVVLAEGVATAIEVTGILGRGGFGVVLDATDGNRRLAVKLPLLKAMQPGYAKGVPAEIDALLRSGNFPEAVRRFQSELQSVRSQLQAGLSTPTAIAFTKKFRRECIALQRLKHPNIVHLRFIGEIDAVFSGPHRTLLPCLAMDIVDGANLQQRIIGCTQSLKQELPTILKVCRDTALALAALHDMELCHRDISWNNILLTREQVPVLIDLGNVNDPDGAGDTRLQMFEGVPGAAIAYTPGFVAPEVVESWAPNEASDQFSLGVLLYVWCLRGHVWPYNPKPVGSFITNNPNDPNQPIPLADRLKAEIRGVRNSPDKWQPDELQGLGRLSSIVQRMLNKQHQHRFPCMRDVAAELQSLLIDLKVERYSQFDDVELQPVDDFLELCRQVSFQSPGAAHGCLFLQLMVHQARLHLSRSISHIWKTLFSTFHGSADLSSLAGMQTAVEQIDKMVNDLNTAFRDILLSFDKVRNDASLTPRFGGRLRQLLGQVRNHLQPLVTHNRECKRSLKGMVAYTQSVRGNEDVDPILRQNASKHVSQLWDIVSELQAALGVSDYELALYTTRLRAVLAKTRTGHTGNGR